MPPLVTLVSNGIGNYNQAISHPDHCCSINHASRTPEGITVFGIWSENYLEQKERNGAH
jgi:hypothetical protein